ncbi:coxsackievirus and adenovirus receptor homolog [Erpetoichthys calabaricus]|nr:coxsackievirus and adenovirus receptor homolog [Erpetoichthys calabaricus]
MGCTLLYYLLIASFSIRVYGLTMESTDTISLEKVSGETAVMDCKFTTASSDIGQLGIEWVLLPPDVQSKDTMLLMYSAGMVYDKYYDPVIGRIHLSSQDPASGDASVELTNLKPTDSGTYQCRVKKIPGNGNRKITLNVIVKPSTPRCYIEGTPENTQDIALKCLSSEGTAPMSYSWSKITDTKTLPQNAVLDNGALFVKNLTDGNSGTYQCVVTNRAGTDQCIVNLSVVPPKNTSGVIAGAIIGTLLALLALAIILICWYRTRNKKKYEKEISHEIKEDVPPPKSRASTARSFTSVGSNRSSLGSMSPSNLHEYSLKPHYDKIPSEEYERPPSQAPNLPSAKVAGPNLSRAGAVPVMIPAQSRDGSIV